MGTTVDCLVLCKDKVIRAMLATCARSVGLSVHAGGSAQYAVEALGTHGLTYRLALVGPSVEDSEAAKVAGALVASGKIDKVLGFGLRVQDTSRRFEERCFPVDFAELFRELRAPTAREAPAAQAA
jgi:hypothetical protein